MNFKEYQQVVEATAVYPKVGENIIYPVLGLCGESGEIAEKVKKVLRDNSGEFNNNIITELIKELGDVLWYITALSLELGTSLQEVATRNAEKLYSRKDRNVLHGSGDNR